MKPTKNISQTILVTGGAGYIGSHTIIELINSGHKVISADNYINSSPDTYKRIKKITGKTVKHYNVDLCNLTLTKKIFIENPSIKGIIHFAALKSVPESVEKPLLYYRNNFVSLINIMECIKSFNIPNLIFSSSCSVYGNVKTLPVNENTPTGEVECPYAYTKLVGERMIQDFAAITPETKAVSLRYFNPVGAHDSGLNGELPLNKPNNLVPIITQTAIGKIKMMNVFGNDYKTRDGTCVRDYIHVSDIADAHVKALKFINEGRQDSNYSLFNLGSGNGVTVLEAIKAFEKISKKKLNYKFAPRRSGDVAAIYSDSSKALKLLNWKPKHTIESMMDTAWKWEQNLIKK
jgi:UDP-glucose 4-epimerase